MGFGVWDLGSRAVADPIFDYVSELLDTLYFVGLHQDDFRLLLHALPYSVHRNGPDFGTLCGTDGRVSIFC